MWKWFRWIILVIIIFVLFAVGAYILENRKFENSRYAKFITASPIDLDQIDRISYVRSCAGHDYSGENIDGELEKNRSMKHYAIPMETFNHTNNQVKIFAPWEGKITKIEAASKAGSTGSSIYFSKDGWWFEIGHVIPRLGLRAGQRVKSGELVGYAEPVDGSAFDLQFYHSGRHIDWLKGIDSYMNHLAPNVETYYAKYGLTPENMVISKNYRDQNPCQGFNNNPMEDQIVVKH